MPQTNQSSPTAPGPASASGSNKLDIGQLLARATELGEQAGRGKDTQIKFLLSCCEGGYHSAVDLQPDKHGADTDDATKLAEAYVKAQGSATTFDAKAGNQRKLVATLRTSIKLGMWPKGGNGEPLATVGNLLAHRQSLRKDPTFDKKRLDDAANTFLRYARQQLRRDLLIDGEELKSFCLKPTKDPKTAEERVESIRNSINSLYKGAGGVQDHSAKVKTALDALTDRLVEIAKAKGKAQAGGAAK